MNEERDQMEALREALTARKVKRDRCGDPVIVGRRGNIHADGRGFSLYATYKNGLGLNRCKAAFEPFTQLRQEGDTEGVWHMPGLLGAAASQTIRYWLRIPKRKQYDAATLEKKRRMCLAARESLTATIRSAPESTIGCREG